MNFEYDLFYDKAAFKQVHSSSARSFRLIHSYLTYNLRLEQCFSLTPNQSAVLSAMAYKPIQPKRTYYMLLNTVVRMNFFICSLRINFERNANSYSRLLGISVMFVGLIWLINRTFSVNEQYFSLTPNQLIVLSAMIYQSNKPKQMGRGLPHGKAVGH